MRIVAPTRVAHTWEQHLAGDADRVFALLCPVREADWIEGWDPHVVITASGTAELDCIFVTGSGAEEAVWVVTEYDRSARSISFVKVTPGGTVARIAIKVVPAGSTESRATITYQHTALGPAGEALVAGFTAEHYAHFMRQWETRLNHYLTTGSALPEARATPEQRS